MNDRIAVPIAVAVLAALVTIGCRGSKPKPLDELAAVMQADMVKPVVAGPHREWVVTRELSARTR